MLEDKAIALTPAVSPVPVKKPVATSVKALLETAVIKVGEAADP